MLAPHIIIVGTPYHMLAPHITCWHPTSHVGTSYHMLAPHILCWHPTPHVGIPHQMWSAPQVRANPPILFISTSLMSSYFFPALQTCTIWKFGADGWCVRLSSPVAKVRLLDVTEWRDILKIFRVNTCANSSVPVSPSCAQNAHTPLHMLKIPCQHFYHRWPNGVWHGNR